MIHGPWKLRIINPKISKFVPLSAMLSVEGKKILIMGLGLPYVDRLFCRGDPSVRRENERAEKPREGRKDGATNGDRARVSERANEKI